MWQACLESGEALSAHDYNACARTLERLGQWEIYREVVARGLCLFPADPALQIRLRHVQAVFLMEEKRWQEAWQLLERLREQLREDALSFDWPCGMFYWSRQARYEKALASIEGKQQRLQTINELSLFKSSELLPQRVAGILLGADCLDWPPSLRAEFGRCMQPLIDCLRCYDQPVRLIEDPALPAAVADLATFWRGNLTALKGLPAGDCEFFARLFLCFGYLNLYLQLRADFISALNALDAGNMSTVALAYRIALANELGDSAEFDRLSEIAQAQANTREYARISAIYHTGHSYERPLEDEDRDFAEYIQGKSIAIVGPVDVGLDSGAEIDGFDLVVRFNHREGLGYETRCFGSRTDVSYYVKVFLDRESPPPGMLPGMAKLDYAVFNKNSIEGCAWLKKITSCRTRERQGVWSYLENPLLIGYANFVPRAVLDLLCFKPSRIKVFCSNLYTGMSYRSEYLQLSSLGRNGGNIFPGISVHDPVSNFILMQRMVQRGAFEVDEVLQEILSWSVTTYIDRLSTAHAKFLALPAQGTLLEAEQ